ncbi:MAG: FAD-binding protein [Candidatus Geothermincolia bacterium]
MNGNGSAAKELKRLLGEGNVRTGAQALSSYFTEPVEGADFTVVRPQNVDQLADVAAFSNENEIPLFSVKRKTDSGNLSGRKGILVDVSGMNQIKKIDVRNLTANVFAGVTFEQLAKELAKENQRLLYPLAGTSPYIVRSYMDRDVLMGEGGYRHPHISVFHAMMADGQLWVSGSQQLTDEGHADFREDQGPQFSPFFGASEDIFGIPYYGLVYTYPNREERRLVAFGFNELGPAKDLLYKVSRAEWCFEAFAANDRYLSVVLANGDAGAVAGIKKKLNPWTVVITMEHYKDLVDLWDRYTREAAKDLGAKALKGQVPDSCEAALQKPWNLYDRDFFKGRARDVNCYNYFKNVGDTFAAIDEQASSAGLKPDDLGKIVVPVYFGASAYCEADFYFDPKDAKAAASVEKARLGAYEALIDAKAFIDRPRGAVAEMLYSKMDPSYVNMIKLFKRTVDPKGLLNPDQLLEGV